MNKFVLVAAGSLVVAAGAAVMSAVTAIKYRVLTKKLGKSVDRIEVMTEDSIASNMIQVAVNKAADSKVDQYMKETEDAVLRAANRNLEIQARNAVENAASEIRDKASEEITRQVSNLDVEKLKARVCDQAEKHVMDKLDKCLDESAKKFQDQLDSTKKIFDGINRAMLEKKKEDSNGSYVVMF